mgnify:CR=1 FL=1
MLWVGGWVGVGWGGGGGGGWGGGLIITTRAPLFWAGPHSKHIIHWCMFGCFKITLQPKVTFPAGRQSRLFWYGTAQRPMYLLRPALYHTVQAVLGVLY